MSNFTGKYATFRIIILRKLYPEDQKRCWILDAYIKPVITYLKYICVLIFSMLKIWRVVLVLMLNQSIRKYMRTILIHLRHFRKRLVSNRISLFDFYLVYILLLFWIISFFISIINFYKFMVFYMFLKIYCRLLTSNNVFFLTFYTSYDL